MADCAKISRRFEWANLTSNYPDVFDYIAMCNSCHQKFDNAFKEAWRPKKLTAEQVRTIRSRAGTKFNYELGRDFGISGALVGMTVAKKIWKTA